MKAVLISIQPKWCELIASGKKTVEIRKTKPKIDVPFKCYIYCTKGDWLTMVNGKVQKPNTMKIDLTVDSEIQELNGKVIGEFVCDSIGSYEYDQAFDESMGCYIDKYGYDIAYTDLGRTCLSYEDFESYGNTQNLYGWHISDLVIYDKPKELSEFFHYCGDNPKCDGCEAHYFSNTECGKEDYCCSIIDGCKPLKRPPQSWCYVEERSADNEQREAD